MTIAVRIAALRKQKGLTQQALADVLGLHVTQVRRYELGSSQPSMDALKKIARTFCVTTDSLVFDEGELEPDSDLALQFQAISNMPEEKQEVIKQLLDGMIIKYEAEKWSSRAK